MLEKIVNSLQDGDEIIVFKSCDKYKEDKEYFDNIMKNHNGRYRLPAKCKSLTDYVEKAKLVLFQNNNEQEILGYGILEEYNNKNKFLKLVTNEKTCNYGPYEITEELRKEWPEVYEYSNELKKYVEKENYQSKFDFDKKYYKFKEAKLLLETISLNEIITYPKEKDKKALVSLFNRGCSGTIQPLKIVNVKEFREYLKRKKLKCELLDCFKEKDKIYNYSLIEQIDFYDIENIHTAFLYNFILPTNIYGLKKKPLKELLELIIRKCKLKDQLDKVDVLKDNYKICTQTKYGNIKPDITLVGDKYRIIIENKFYGFENTDNQMEKYYNYFENDSSKLKNIYVFLSMSYQKLSLDKYDDVFLSKLLIKDLVKVVYRQYDDMKNIEIFNDFMKSFMYIVENNSIKIDDIPYVPGLLSNKLCKTIISNNQIQKVLDEKAKMIFKDNYEFITCKYALVCLYNNYESNMVISKNDIEKIYNSFRYVKEKN